MYKFLVKSAGSGYTANCISLNADLNSYAVVDNEKHYEPGTVFNFDYTGTVQEVELLPGKYKLQCWGAQGGDKCFQESYQSKEWSYGGKGGYSEGEITITRPITVYIFVGGKPTASYDIENNNVHDRNMNGGWNGGGGAHGYSYGKVSNNDNNRYTTSLFTAGGGATDIATVTSDMSYTNYQTNRSLNSLLSRFIVAGGGGGGCMQDSFWGDGSYHGTDAVTSGVGGGNTGGGPYPGRQTYTDYSSDDYRTTNGLFGYGAYSSSGSSPYKSGGGGGGWYGGSVSYASRGSEISNGKSNGGSGFVNTEANIANRPEGYTGLQLDNGTTVVGNVSFISPTGNEETGHSGNGYARITVLDPNYTPPKATISWSATGTTWNESSNSSAVDGKQLTCVSPGSSGSTTLRCTFSGVTSITFSCRSQGENNYDYLTAGKIDTACSRSSYNTSLKGVVGWNQITYACDSGEHYVEFCYSKDGSVDTQPDNADVYVYSVG